MSCYLRRFGKTPWFGLVKSLPKTFPNPRTMGTIRDGIPSADQSVSQCGRGEMSSAVGGTEKSPLAPALLDTANILLGK